MQKFVKCKWTQVFIFTHLTKWKPWYESKNMRTREQARKIKMWPTNAKNRLA